MNVPMIPDFLEQMLQPFQKLFHQASWESFKVITLGLMLELATGSLVRATLLTTHLSSLLLF